MDNYNISAFISLLKSRHGEKIQDSHKLYDWSIRNPENFWSLVWDFCNVLGEKGNAPYIAEANDILKAKFFPEGRLNFAENLLKQSGKHSAIIFHGEDKVKRTLSWDELRAQVSDLQTLLINQGVTQDDVVAGYIPNMPEAVIGMLATASLGAIWTSCSPDFGVSAVVDRFGQTKPKVVITADYYYWKGEKILLAEKVNEIRKLVPSIKEVITSYYSADSNNRGADALRSSNRENLYGSRSICFAKFSFNHPLYILYSSGTTGKPKCIVHSAGGTLLEHLKELILHTDLKSEDVIFYQTTCGWMMWNWLVSALSTGATLVLYDGFPLIRKGNILFDLIDSEKISVFGTNAKFLSLIEKERLKPKTTHSLESLKTILSTGSPLSSNSFDYVYSEIKKGVHLSSISGGTDILGCFALGAPDIPVHRGELQIRSFGLNVQVFNENGAPVYGEKGELVCTAPFPSRPVRFWNDPNDEKYNAAYFSRFPNVWHHGDYVEITKNDGMIFYGRSDSVLNPGGVRIGTAEIYQQVEKLAEVKESIAVGKEVDGDVKILLFVILQDGITLDAKLKDKIKKTIKNNTSPYHVPKEIMQVADIPRTKNGKISESSVREIINARQVKNIDALLNPESLAYYQPR